MRRQSGYWKQIEANRRLLEGEIGTVAKDWGGRLPVALIYSNSYAVGMASLGFQAIYGLLSARGDVVCERVFEDGRWDGSPAPLSLESGRELDDFALWAFSLSFELDYPNAVNLIRRAGIEPLAAHRSDEDPLLLAGGPAISANPHPLGPIFDAFFIGEVEESLDAVVDAVADEFGQRGALLQRWAAIPGMYVPALHGLDYRVQRQWIAELDHYPTCSVIWAGEAEFGDMHLVEVSRGCGRGCRFCLVGHTLRPARERSLPAVKEAVRAGLPYRNKVGLVGSAVSDYGQIDELVGWLSQKKVRLSVSSLRADSVSPALLDALAWGKTQTLTIAPEAGSERLRATIGKRLKEEDLLRVVHMAAVRDFPSVKLYYIIGLPGENEEDVQALIDLTGKVKQAFGRQVVATVTPFVPKAHTRFEREAPPEPKQMGRRIRRIEKSLRSQGIACRPESPEWAQIQALLSLGDQSLAQVLLGLSRPSLAAWKAGLNAAGIELSHYLRSRERDERLPWENIHIAAAPAREIKLRG